MTENTGVPSPNGGWAESNSRLMATPGPMIPSVQSMSLRDYFAAQALPEAISHERHLRSGLIRPGAFRFDAIAEAAYVVADAMLKERAK